MCKEQGKTNEVIARISGYKNMNSVQRYSRKRRDESHYEMSESLQMGFSKDKFKVLPSLNLFEDEGALCISCGDDCPGLVSHNWRCICMHCGCRADSHNLEYSSFDQVIQSIMSDDHRQLSLYIESQRLAKLSKRDWVPIGLMESQIASFIASFDGCHLTAQGDSDNIDEDRLAQQTRQLRLQFPAVDFDISRLQMLNLEDKEEVERAETFFHTRNNRAMGLGRAERMSAVEGMTCFHCSLLIFHREYCVRTFHLGARSAWHPTCFKCVECHLLLAGYLYFHLGSAPFCERDYAQRILPRCRPCDELIFAKEYTTAMNEEQHTGHFACKQCEKSLTGHRYILKEEQPYCLQCYEETFANLCEDCKEKIGCDSKDLSFKERHWHEKCFKCTDCTSSLVDRPFATKENQLYCADCYDNKFAARCDGCTNVFKAGMRKYEYRGKQWHEECFLCMECQQPIGAKSFIPREQNVVCVPCYEAKYAQRCTKCMQVIRRGGVTYKGDPWHKECFTCTNCDKALAGIKFTSKEDKPYCAECYGELFAKKCCKCTKPITAPADTDPGFGGCKFISFEDRHWHSECFSCNKCDCNLVGRGFLTNEDRIICPDCGR